MMMTDIGDVVELVVDIPPHNLHVGARGTVVLRHSEDAYEVEFSNEDGETVELLALYPHQFVVVWRADTHTWVPLSEQTAHLVATLPDQAAQEVLDFARFLKSRVENHQTTVA